MNFPGGRVVVVHDYLTQRGGAERVTLDLLRAFPGSRLVTSVWDKSSTFPEFAEHDVETLWLQRCGPIRHDPRRAFPLLARAFHKHTIDDADLVICSSSGWSHRVNALAPKIVYCHNPARWLYQSEDYFPNLSPRSRSAFLRMTRGLRRTDVTAARTAQQYLVNSSTVAERVRRTYGIEPRVLPPSRGLSPDGPVEPIDGIQPGYLITVARSRGYKHTKAVCEAVASMPDERLVIVGGRELPNLPPNVVRVADISDAQLRWLYSEADGLVAVAHEDFGLTAVEAQSFGLPAVLLRAGGYLDSSIEHVTNVFVDTPTASAVTEGIWRLRAHIWDHSIIRRHGDQYSAGAFAARVQAVARDVIGGITGDTPDLPCTERSVPSVDQHRPAEARRTVA